MCEAVEMRVCTCKSEAMVSWGPRGDAMRSMSQTLFCGHPFWVVTESGYKQLKLVSLSWCLSSPLRTGWGPLTPRRLRLGVEYLPAQVVQILGCLLDATLWRYSGQIQPRETSGQTMNMLEALHNLCGLGRTQGRGRAAGHGCGKGCEGVWTTLLAAAAATQTQIRKLKDWLFCWFNYQAKNATGAHTLTQ